MFNHYKKYLLIIGASLVVLVTVSVLLKWFAPKAQVQFGDKINFTELGFIKDAEPENFNQGIQLVYEEPGAPALTAKLVFDEKSVCNFSGQSIICMALNATIDAATKDKKVFVEGIRSGDAVLVRNLAIDKEYGRKFGLVRGVRENNQNLLVDIDEVEMLSGDVAIIAAIKDTGCAREKIYDCVPSLNNDFYVRNIDGSLKTYIVDENTDIALFKNPGSPTLEKTTMENFLKKWKEPQTHVAVHPFKFMLEGSLITELEEQYLP